MLRIVSGYTGRRNNMRSCGTDPCYGASGRVEKNLEGHKAAKDTVSMSLRIEGPKVRGRKALDQATQATASVTLELTRNMPACQKELAECPGIDECSKTNCQTQNAVAALRCSPPAGCCHRLGSEVHEKPPLLKSRPEIRGPK